MDDYPCRTRGSPQFFRYGSDEYRIMTSLSQFSIMDSILYSQIPRWKICLPTGILFLRHPPPGHCTRALRMDIIFQCLYNALDITSGSHLILYLHYRTLVRNRRLYAI